jgi:hypothetical protein
MGEEIATGRKIPFKPVSYQFKTTFYPPAIMECPFCRTTSEETIYIAIYEVS